MAHLMEADLKYLQRHGDPSVRLSPAVASIAEAIAKKYQSSPGKMDGWENDRLPWRKIRETVASHPAILREAHPSTAFGQLLRAGVQLIANSWYKRHTPTYEKIAVRAGSDKRQEFYPPLFGAARPQEVKPGTPFREQGVKGQDLEIINRKFGSIESFKRELFDDDQTGQIKMRAGALGESMRMWRDQYFSRRFIGVASTDFAPTTIEASMWTGVNAAGAAISTPFSTVMYSTTAVAAGNRPASFGQFQYSMLLDAYEALRQAKDPLGQAMVVVPDVLLVSPFDEINARMALLSPAFPAVSGRTGETASTAASGFFRGPFGANPLMNEFQLVVNVHLKRGVWAVGQGGKGYVDQERDPMEIVQELPQSGQSFEVDAYRFRSRARWEQDWIDPRFWYLGNDGSAALTQ